MEERRVPWDLNQSIGFQKRRGLESPEFYTYSVMNTHGKRSSAKLYKRIGGQPVDLVSTGKGIITVGLFPYVAPKPGSEKIRKASERPF